MFLTHQELTELTGHARKSKQIEWLSDHGYNFDVNARGRPVVVREQVLERQRVLRSEKVVSLDKAALKRRMQR